MLDILQPKITLSIPEFLSLERNETTIKEIKLKRKIEAEGITADNMDKYLKNEWNKAFRKKTFVAIEVFMITTLATCKKVLAAVDPKEIDPKVVEAMKKVDHGGWMIMFIFRKVAFWICLIMCFLEVLRCVTQGDMKNVLKIIVKYVLIYGVSYIMPIIFEFIEFLFQ